MSKKNNDLEMVTFQPFGEETLMKNEEEINQIPALEEQSSSLKSQKEKIAKSNKLKSEKFNGVIIGFIIVVLFVAYDAVMR